LSPAALATAAGADPAIAALLGDERELWRNDRYIVHVTRRSDGSVAHMSIRRTGKGAVRDWRHLQRIKNELAGPDTEASSLPRAVRRCSGVR